MTAASAPAPAPTTVPGPARRGPRSRVWLTVTILVGLLVGLPAAVWLDMKGLTEASLERQAADLNSMITGIRGFYASDVVARVLSNHGNQISVRHDYDVTPGGIPLPASLSLALGRVIAGQQSNISYRFVSDFPFTNRKPHALDDFERSALAALRVNPDKPLMEVSTLGLDSTVRMISAVTMAAPCVSCHNTHPQSLKTDWKVGDVRGIQEVSVNQQVALSLASFKYVLAYLIFVALAGIGFIALQRRQNHAISEMNAELRGSNDFLANISMKISHYLSPQVYKSIFSGEMDVSIQTTRKQLTIFFSDIKDFTALTEKLQPEEITALINEYFSEMSTIALHYGGTIDKFIGDAILVFFGDPVSKGSVEDAQACVRMGIDMQNRIAELNVSWRQKGAEEPFQVRMGINTGYCNVGNFGSTERMDYTILGAEANLAARLQSMAGPGRIVMSYETYALVSPIVSAHPLPPVTMKGLSREVVPYEVDALIGEDGAELKIFTEHAAGIDLYLNLGRVDPEETQRLRGVLGNAMEALDAQSAREANKRAVDEWLARQKPT